MYACIMSEISEVAARYIRMYFNVTYTYIHLHIFQHTYIRITYFNIIDILVEQYFLYLFTEYLYSIVFLTI